MEAVGHRLGHNGAKRGAKIAPRCHLRGSRTGFEKESGKSCDKVAKRGRKYEFSGVANVAKVLQILCKSHIPPFLKELVHRTAF